ncbi:MAG: hypothetical protein RL000_1701 [Bacteroidota bacterium]|jgi:hypothetical protein
MNSDIRKLLLIACYFMSTLGVVAQNTAQIALTFTFQENSIQNYTIPVSGWYKLEKCISAYFFMDNADDFNAFGPL